MDATWIIQEIMDNENNKLKLYISGEHAQLIEGFVIDDSISMSTSAGYGDIGEALNSIIQGGLGLADGVVGALLSKYPALGTLKEKWSDIAQIANGAAQIIGMGKPVPAAVRTWQGSSLECPSVHMLFVALKEDDRPQDKAKTILSCLLPASEGPEVPGISSITKNLGNFFYWSPRKYSPAKVAASLLGDLMDGRMGGYGGPIEGTCTLEIGKWFSIDGLLPTSAQFNFSKETTKQGNPLYVEGTVTFTTYRDMKENDFRNTFK